MSSCKVPNKIELSYKEPEFNIEIYQDSKMVAKGSDISFIPKRKPAPIYVTKEDLGIIKEKRGHAGSIIFSDIDNDLAYDAPFTIRIKNDNAEMFLLGVELTQGNLKDIESNKLIIFMARAVLGWRPIKEGYYNELQSNIQNMRQET